MKPLSTEPPLTPPDYFEPADDPEAEAVKIVEAMSELPFNRISERLNCDHPEIFDRLLERIWKDTDFAPHVGRLKLLMDSVASAEAKADIDEQNKREQGVRRLCLHRN
ncbi:MAG: hypothetical protein N0E44_22890 [Candidatus Thiodiazotropha lotti]|nr:hypothetical protein [Candidatus Thiodiazotropha lotti]MCW4222717.1 hypothetical protein [Candidatus Thiodiazotropha lotti]